MPLFHNILVGVDLTQYDAKTLQPSAVAQGVVRQALWLAEKTKGRLTFFSVLDLRREALPMFEEADFHHLTSAAEQSAAKVLRGLVQQAQSRGIEAVEKTVVGSIWMEVIRQAQHGQHDLVLIGTRDRSGMERMLFGSTAIKLVRRCACPVWVAKPGMEPNPLRVLVASDLDPAAEEALRLVVELARVAPVAIHLLHAVNFPLDRHWITPWTGPKEEAYRRRIREHAVKELQAQIDRVGGGTVTPPIEVHLLDELGVLPDESILHFLKKTPIDVMAMGTLAHSGLAGVMIGNTAERLLPQLSCSLLAVKPKGFVSPVSP